MTEHVWKLVSWGLALGSIVIAGIAGFGLGTRNGYLRATWEHGVENSFMALDVAEKIRTGEVDAARDRAETLVYINLYLANSAEEQMKMKEQPEQLTDILRSQTGAYYHRYPESLEREFRSSEIPAFEAMEREWDFRHDQVKEVLIKYQPFEAE